MKRVIMTFVVMMFAVSSPALALDYPASAVTFQDKMDWISASLQEIKRVDVEKLSDRDLAALSDKTEALRRMSHELPGGYAYGAAVARSIDQSIAFEINRRGDIVGAARAAKARADADAARVAAEAARVATIRSKGWPAPIERAAVDRKVLIGMTAVQVEAAVGAPKEINETVRASGRSEQWVYGSRSFVYLENGRVTSIQTSR